MLFTFYSPALQTLYEKMASPTDYVQSLEIDLPDPQLSELARNSTASKGQGYVDGGSLVSFVSGITPAAQSDVLNSTLLAQLAANKQHDRFKDTVEWYKSYVHVLEKVGWSMQKFHFNRYNASGATMKISEAILEVVKSVISGADLAVVESTLEALKVSANEWWTVFSASSDTGEAGNFQILPCMQDSGVVSMNVCCFYFSGGTTRNRWLWAEYLTSTMNIFEGTTAATLNLDIYSQVREAVIHKLGANAQTYVGNLEI